MFGLGAWLARSALMQSPIGGFLKAVPRQVWIALAIALALFIAFKWHGHRVNNALATAEKRGEQRAYARVEAKALKIAAGAADISAKARSLNSEKNRRIAVDADALRVRGPGRAACLNPAATAAGRYVAPAGRSDAPRPQMPAGDQPALPDALAAVPWPWLVNRAEQCDLNRAEAETWRSWHAQLVAQWKKDGGK